MTPVPTRSESPFSQAGRALLAAGYHPIPVMPGDKAPGEMSRGRWQPMVGWPRYRDEAPAPFIVRLWSTWESANVGVVLGTKIGSDLELIALDFDTDDTFLLEMIESAVPIANVRKRGRRGYTGFYVAPAGTRGRRFRRGKQVIFEILTGNATRQTIVPPSIHPDTGEPYVWLTRGTLADTPPLSLVVLTEDMLDRLTDTLESLEGVEEARAPARTIAADGDTPHRALNSLALANLASWVPALPLHKLKGTGNGYRAAAHWRAGGNVDAWNANVGIHPEGITDFGADQGHTALDLVMLAANWPLDHAFEWLAGRLGWAGQGFGEDLLIQTPEATPGLPAHDPETGEVFEEHSADPDELPEHLTHIPGLLGELVNWITATSQKPIRTLSLGPALVAMGTLLGNRIAGPTRAGTHLYVAALAPSGAGKDHGLKQIYNIMDLANAGYLKGPSWFKSETSVENFIARTQVGVCAVDEIGLKLRPLLGKQAKGFETGIVSSLMTLWSATPFSGSMASEWAGKQTEELPPTSVSLYGVSTEQAFFSGLSGNEVVNGFLNRWLLLRTGKRMLREDAESDPHEMPKALQDRLIGFRSTVSRMTPNDMDMPIGQSFVRVAGWGIGAKELARDFERLLFEIEEDPERGAFFGRAWEMSIRLATIRAAGRSLEPLIVERDDVEWGQKLAMWSAERMADAAHDNIAENDRARFANRIKSFLKGKDWTPHRAIQMHLKAALKTGELADLLKDLHHSGVIDTKLPTSLVMKNGRPPGVAYRLAKRRKHHADQDD